MSSRFPTMVDFSLERLAAHGGLEGPHGDGWGVAYYEGRDVVVLREPAAASESELVHFMERHGPPSDLVISHIRLATQGNRSLRNTQPFQRELGGRVHVFAHNGRLDGIEGRCNFATHRFKPVGDTDSEYAYCCLLEQLAPVWDGIPGDVPDLERRFELVAGFAAWLRPMGPSNFIYSDGDAVFVHAHKRTQRDGSMAPPGIHMLTRTCDEECPDLTHAGIKLETVPQQLTLVASVPLTDEDWKPLVEGELIALRSGEIVMQMSA